MMNVKLCNKLQGYFWSHLFHRRKNILHALVYRNASSLASNKVEVDSVNIAYTKAGTGPHVALCLPGALGYGAADFKPQLSGLAGSQVTLIAWDPPGYGDSTPHTRYYGPDFLHRDANIAAAMMKKLGYPKYSVLGWSDGGITGLILAATYTTAVNNLLVWGANAFVGPADIKLYEAVRDLKNWSARMRQPMEEKYGVEGFEKLWHGWVDALINIYKHHDGDLCRSLLQNIECPTLIMHGNKDAMVPDYHPTYLKENITNSILERIEDGKHNFHMKYADQFNKRAMKFIIEGK